MTVAVTRTSAIPTLYRGVMFRSRLEARWAAFFDLIRRPWRYEAIDLAGYIPDFLVLDAEHPGGCRCIPGISCDQIVEVKPALSPDELYAAADKIDRSGWRGMAYCVGVAPDVAIQTIAPLGEYRWGPTDGYEFGDRDEEWNAAGNLVQYKRPT